MDWGNDVHGPVYPVGNIHLQYFEEVTERFVDGGLKPEGVQSEADEIEGECAVCGKPAEKWAYVAKNY